ncbi:hypothetical protein [Burkholderia cenocepacia]|uniref:hypothetical protein n=1 Tax=Burkholderia cenocepacia TaxID=95486 RepID=UPI0007621F0D|nr:hypothetical protein [Burkholderia cenocepacia]KWU19090.1 hypothetical protein AS149_12650 [Burkholderia cenocepacia]
MLTVANIQELATRHPIQVLEIANRNSPKGKTLSVWFKGEDPDVWETLMTNETEVAVRIHGTRTVTGSGATDDQLLPVYAARVVRVNERRAELGLKPVYI